MTTLHRWRALWPVTQFFLIPFRFGMWVKHLPKGAPRAVLFVPGALAAVLSSVVYNFTFGSVILGELPLRNEWMFTHRIQREWNVLNTHTEEKQETLRQIVALLNEIDEGHIKT